MRNILDLKKTQHQPILQKAQGRQRPFQIGFVLLPSFVILFMLLDLFVAPLMSRASVATFYPGICSGGWQHPEHAQGEFSVISSAHPEDFTSGNSAYADASAGPLECSGFSGAAPEDAKAKVFTLSVSWAFINAVPAETPSASSEVTAEPTVEPTEEENDASEGVNSEAENGGEIPVDEQQEADSEEPEVSPTPAIDPVEAEMPEVVPTQEETSDASEEESNADESSSDSLISRLFAHTVFAQEPSSEEQGQVLSVAPVSAEPLIAVSYRLDDGEWKVAGNVGQSDWQDAQFDIVLADWQDISKLQVRLEILPTSAEMPAIYLDGMRLDVQHNRTPIVVPSVSEIIADLAIFDASKGFFLLPLSANIVPPNMLPVAAPTIALADTLILESSSREPRGLVIYRISDGILLVNTFVGAGNESAHSGEYFGEGEFAMITTAVPDQCEELSLVDCRAHQGYLDEKLFSITASGTPVVPASEPVDEVVTQEAIEPAEETAPVEDENSIGDGADQTVADGEQDAPPVENNDSEAAVESIPTEPAVEIEEIVPSVEEAVTPEASQDIPTEDTPLDALPETAVE